MNSFDEIDQDTNDRLTGAELAPHVLQMFSGMCCPFVTGYNNLLSNEQTADIKVWFHLTVR